MYIELFTLTNCKPSLMYSVNLSPGMVVVVTGTVVVVVIAASILRT